LRVQSSGKRVQGYGFRKRVQGSGFSRRRRRIVILNEVKDLHRSNA
jgi:hypothetical protein